MILKGLWNVRGETPLRHEVACALSHLAYTLLYSLVRQHTEPAVFFGARNVSALLACKFDDSAHRNVVLRMTNMTTT